MQPHNFPYKNVVIIGTTGSGKSTLAEALAKKFALRFVELDALHWRPAWQAAPVEEFRTLVLEATRQPGWIIAGNYSATREITWPRAEVVIWLDYPFWTNFWRLLKRTLRRWWTQELLWGTNRERLLPQFKIWSPEESLFRWLFDTYKRRKREYPLLFALPEYSHLQVIHLHSPRETDEWFGSLSS